MSSWRSALIVALALAATAGQAAEPTRYGYGTPATPAQIASWSISVRPDGRGLPEGRGSVAQGDELYQTHCAACHGTFGEGTRFPRLAGDGKLTGDRPEQTVGSYWPYATTLFDYINRAMPYPAPHSLTADEVYAVSAFILNLNTLVPDDFVADRTSLPKVVMPNVKGFTWADPRPDTHDTACMRDCRPPASVKISSTAEGSRVTPRTTGTLDTELPQ